MSGQEDPVTGRKITPTGRGTFTTSKGTELKQERALRTRLQILNAAAQAFADKGFPQVTIQCVADLAGTTKGAVYFHYTNKEELARAVADEFYRALSEIVASVENDGLSPLTSVTELLGRTARAFRDDIAVQAGARLQIERSLISVPLPTPYVGYTGLVTAWLEKAAQDGQIDSRKDPATLARVLVAAFFGAQHISWVLNERMDITERATEVVSLLLPTAAGEPYRPGDTHEPVPPSKRNSCRPAQGL